MKNIAGIIKQRRRELDLTLKEIGNKVGVSEPTVQRWESGDIKNLRHGRIIKLAEALQVNPAYLMGWDKDPEPTDKEKEMLETYSRAKQSDKTAIKALVAAIDKLLKIDEQEP